MRIPSVIVLLSHSLREGASFFGGWQFRLAVAFPCPLLKEGVDGVRASPAHSVVVCLGLVRVPLRFVKGRDDGWRGGFRMGLVVGWGFPPRRASPAVASLPRPLRFAKGAYPLCPSDISPTSGGNPAPSLPPLPPHPGPLPRGERGIPSPRPPLGSCFRRNDGVMQGRWSLG